MQQKPATSTPATLALPASCHLSAVKAEASAQTFLEFLEESIQVRARTGLNPLWQVDSSTAEKKYSCGSFSITDKTQATKGAAPCFEITYQKNSDTPGQQSAQEAAFKKLFEGLTNPLMTMNCQISSEKDLQQLREFIDLAQRAAPTGVTLQWDFSQVKLTGKDPALNTLKAGYEAIINPLSQLPASRKVTPTPIAAPQPVTANPQRNTAGIAMPHGAAQAAKGSAQQNTTPTRALPEDLAKLITNINQLADDIIAEAPPLTSKNVADFNNRSEALLTRFESFGKTTTRPTDLILHTLLKELSLLTDKLRNIETIHSGSNASELKFDWISSKFFNLYNMLLAEKHPNAKGQLDYINDRITSPGIKSTLSMKEQAAFEKFFQDMMHKISSAEPREIPQILADNARLINDLHKQFISLAQDRPSEAAAAAAAECMTPPLRRSLSSSSLATIYKTGHKLDRPEIKS